MGSSTLQFPSLDAAIARFENVDVSHNNPGGLQFNSYTQSLGATSGTAGGLANFPTMESGTSAEDALVKHYADAGYTLQDMMNLWAPSSVPGNNPGNEISSIAKDTGFDPNAKVSSMTGASPYDILTGQTPGATALPTTPGATPPVSTGGTVIGRIAAGIVGVILIGAGLFMFKTTQNIIQVGGNVARMAAA